jgi:signal transduction histidine kinase
VRSRLIVAFIGVALLAALASPLIVNLLLPLFPSLHVLVDPPRWAYLLFYERHLPGHGPPQARPFLAVILGLAALLLVAVSTGLAFAASRPVLLPVRRLARAAQRMSDGDLAVRIQPRGRDELAQLVTSFNEMASALEDKVGELEQMAERARQFAGDVSHELRTPLTAMTAVVGILDEHPGLTGDAAVAARLVRQEVQHLNRLVEDIIEMSRFDAGTAQLVTDDTDVAAVVGRCLHARSWTDVSADVPAGLTARLDRRRFDVILANLVGNALRHGALPVTVTAGLQPDGQGGTWLTVDVRDHGDRLPPAAIPHLFDRFYKADTARARSEGSGLGLAIAWENARLHGGHIDAGNHPGGGAIFTVSLPVNGHSPISGTELQAEPARRLQGLPVLVGVADCGGQDALQVCGPARNGALVEFVEVEQYAAREDVRRHVQIPHHAAGDVAVPLLLQWGHRYLAGALGDGNDELRAELSYGVRDDELGGAQVLA